MKKKKLNCSRCGAEMNNHAEKVSYEESAGGYKPDPVFGGVVDEIHTCPGCGNVESRAAG
jgi:ribosomal protein S27AE